jgi:hypothetical protein
LVTRLPTFGHHNWQGASLAALAVILIPLVFLMKRQQRIMTTVPFECAS